jgi:hypothetical protein
MAAVCWQTLNTHVCLFFLFAAHTAVLYCLQRMGNGDTLRLPDIATLSNAQSFARDEHAVVMMALARMYDASDGHTPHTGVALPAAVAAEVSRFAPYSAAAEQPQDSEDAVSLWLAKVTGCINTVAQKEGSRVHQTIMAPVPVMHDFFAACRDGRAIAALLVS